MTTNTFTSRKLTRTTSGRMAGGVCSGVAKYLDIDPTIVRLATVGLCFFGGAGVILYAAAWILMPEEPAAYEPV